MKKKENNCRHCRGRGWYVDMDAYYIIYRECPKCKGTGKKPKSLEE